MGRIQMMGGGGGGSGSSDCTGTKAELLKGYTGILNDTDDEPAEGTLELTGDATVGYVYKGKTFYSTNAKTRLTGTMTVNSLLSFSAAVASGRNVTLTWKNPTAATGKPFSGVYVRYSTSGSPGKTGGTQIYKGTGSNTSSGGTSTATITLPALATKYYLSIYPYVTCSAGEMTGDVINTTVTTGAAIGKTITSTQNYTVPAGYAKLDIFCVGGGGGGSGGSTASSTYQGDGGAGGAGGFTKTVTGIAISAGQVLACIIGAGGTGGERGGSSADSPGKSGTSGGTTSVTRSGTVLLSAAGGGPGNHLSGGNGGSGGANGHAGGNADSYNGGVGGTDGGNGNGLYGGKGQGTTTRAWGSSSGTQYSGGAGGGGTGGTTTGGAGGDRGGGKGGNGMYKISSSSEGTNYSWATAGSNGSANSGGGGGGGGGGLRGGNRVGANGGNGGSGIILMRLY